MSEVLPFSDQDKMSRYGSVGGEAGDSDHLAFTCRLQDTSNFFNGSSTGGNKRPPKLGQIGRSKRVDDDDEEALKNGAAKTPAEA